MTTNAVDVTVPRERWTDVRGDRRQLKAVLWLNRCPLHLEAVEVLTDASGCLRAVAEEDEVRLRALDALYPTRWTTMSLAWPDERRTRAYVAYAMPFGE